MQTGALEAVTIDSVYTGTLCQDASDRTADVRATANIISIIVLKWITPLLLQHMLYTYVRTPSYPQTNIAASYANGWVHRTQEAAPRFAVASFAVGSRSRTTYRRLLFDYVWTPVFRTTGTDRLYGGVCPGTSR